MMSELYVGEKTMYTLLPQVQGGPHLQFLMIETKFHILLFTTLLLGAIDSQVQNSMLFTLTFVFEWLGTINPKLNVILLIYRPFTAQARHMSM